MLTFTVNSCAAGASLPLVARRRTFLDRPHDHLQRAAEAHARITSSEEPTTQDGPETDAVADPSPRSRSARAQRRNQEGKFA